MDIKLIDKVRASREGHHFHEAWAARWALKLLDPKDTLIGVAVEGLSPVDQAGSDEATAQIADLVLYYGAGTSLADCDKQVILQLKYSIAKAHAPLVASDMAKTLKKFSISAADLLKSHRGTDSMAKRSFCVVSNRPFGKHFLDAIDALRTEREPTDHCISSQLMQIKGVLELDPTDYPEFASRLEFMGQEPTLQGLKKSVALRIKSWSAGSVLGSMVRVGSLDEMVRAKAESPGQDNNVIRLADVLNALQLEEVEDLLPTPEAFPLVRAELVRCQGSEIMSRLKTLDRPLLVHGSGGMGKTVLMQQLRESAPDGSMVILFDCFGGGSYRGLSDERHRLNRGLLHIVNQMALKGLCDPLLPGQTDDGMMLRAATKRLSEASATLQEISPGALLVLILDSVDNSAQQALDLGERAFPTQLLAFAKAEGLPAQMRLVMTCRTERRHLLGKKLYVEEFALQPFTQQETAQYLVDALPNIQLNDADIAFARSGGNPRVLAFLTQHWNESESSSRQQTPITVEQLIKDHIQRASDLNHDPDYLDPFLAGLAVLPVPIPVIDYAAAYNVTPEEARSLFVALSPLLEETPFGVIFRDEPTETWVRKHCASEPKVLTELAYRLGNLQDTSHYAGVALPHLLIVLKDVDAAVEMALNHRLPKDLLETTVGRRIKIARVQAALRLAIDHDLSIIVNLLVEAGTLQHAAEKSGEYIAACSDLSAVLGDNDALLQLYRFRSRNPALRHARLTVAYLLAGAPGNAAQHLNYTREWLHLQQGRNTSAPDTLYAVVAVSFYLLCQRDFNAFFGWTVRRSPRDTFEITLQVLSLARALQNSSILVEVVAALRDSETSCPGLLAGVLDTLHELSHADEAMLLNRLAKSIMAKPIGLRLRSDDDPILNAALRAYRLGMLDTCRTLRNSLKIMSPDTSAFRKGAHGEDLPNWLLDSMLSALLSGRQPCLMDILPSQLRRIAQLIPAPTIENLTSHLEALEGVSLEEREEKALMVKTFRTRVIPLMKITAMCSAILDKPAKLNDIAAADLISTCTNIRDELDVEDYTSSSTSNLEYLARNLTFRILRVSQRFSVSNAKAFAQAWHARSQRAFEGINYVKYFADQPSLQEVAGEIADRCSTRIKQMRELDWRRDAYASLARALLPASLNESYGLYREGLKLVDDVDERDSFFLSRVFALSRYVESSELNVSQTSRFVSLCESGGPGGYGGTFPWLMFGAAAAAVLGHRALVLLGHWDRDNNVKLSHSLAPVLVNLLRRHVIDSVQALTLLALAAPEQWKSTRLEMIERREHLDLGLIDALSARGDLKFSEVIEELTHHLELGWAHSKQRPIFLLHALRTAASEHESEVRPSLERLNELINEHTAAVVDPGFPPDIQAGSDHPNPEQELLHRLLKELIAETDPCDGPAIQAAWKLLDEEIYLPAQLFFDGLRAKVKYDQRANHVQALSVVCAPWSELDALLKAIQCCLDSWHVMTSIQDIRPALASMLIKANLSALSREPSSLDDTISKLVMLGHTPIEEVASNIVAAASERKADVAPATWLALGAMLSERLNTQDKSAMVKRLLDSPIAHLAERDAVGSHRKWLTSAGDADECVAGLIWLRLGDQNPRRRTAATDAIVFLAKHKRLALLEKLVARWNSIDVSTLNSESGEFRYLDTHLSLALGLLRALKSEQALELSLMLQSILDTRTCHPLLRQLATEVGAAQTNLPPTLTGVCTPFPWECIAGPEAVLAEEQDYESAYLPRLAKTFSLAPEVIATRVGSTMIQWGAALPDSDLEILQQEDEAPSSRYRSASRKRAFLEHLRWHALLTVGGEFADAYRSSSRSFDDTEWALLIRDAWEECGIQWT